MERGLGSVCAVGLLLASACGGDGKSGNGDTILKGTISYPEWTSGDLTVRIGCNTADLIGEQTVGGGTSVSYSFTIPDDAPGNCNLLVEDNRDGQLATSDPWTAGVIEAYAKVPVEMMKGQTTTVDVTVCPFATAYSTQGGSCATGILGADIHAPSLGNGTFQLHVFDAAGALVDGESVGGSATLASGVWQAMLYGLTEGHAGAFPTMRTPPANPAGTYTAVAVVDGANDGRTAGVASDVAVMKTFTVNGNGVVAFGDADFAQLVAHDVVISNETALANADVYCAFHLPGGDILTQDNQRLFFGGVADTLTAAGSSSGSSVKLPAVRGTLDITCIADVGGSPFTLANGYGADSGVDYIATVHGANINGTSTTVSGFSLIP